MTLPVLHFVNRYGAQFRETTLTGHASMMRILRSNYDRSRVVTAYVKTIVSVGAEKQQSLNKKCKRD